MSNKSKQVKAKPAILIRMDSALREELKNLAHANRQQLEPFLRQSLKDLLVKK